MKSTRKNSSGFGVVELVIVIAVLLIAAVAGYLVYKHGHKSKPVVRISTSSISSSNPIIKASPVPASALNISTQFMNAITKNNPAGAIALSTGGSYGFLDQAAPKVAGSYTETSSVESSGKTYVLYSLTSGPNEEARVILQQTKGVWQVSSFVYESGQLALIPN